MESERLDPTSIDLFALAALVGDGADSAVKQRLAERGHGGIRTSHGYVFQRLLAANPTVGELAEQLAITQQGASKVVGELEHLGYVTKIVDAGDSRARRLELTASGREVVEISRSVRGELAAALTAQVGTDYRSAQAVLAAALSVTGYLERVVTRSVPLGAGNE